jgi:hypothetical protein
MHAQPQTHARRPALPAPVYADGGICLDILQNQWSPIYDVSAILTSIQARRGGCWRAGAARRRRRGAAAGARGLRRRRAGGGGCRGVRGGLKTPVAARPGGSAKPPRAPRSRRPPHPTTPRPPAPPRAAPPPQSLLCDPNPNSPANSEAARLYNENRREYNRRVQEVVEISWQAGDAAAAGSGGGGADAAAAE